MMTKRFSFRLLVATALASLGSAPAVAELPAPVRAMIEAAMASGDADKVAVVAELARQLHPGDAAEITALETGFQQQIAEREQRAAAQAERRIREAGLFQRWSGQGELGGFLTTGNTDEVGVTVAVALKREGIDWSHRLHARGDFRRTNGVTTREQLLVGYEPRYQISDGLFTYALGQFERDRFQGFSERYSLSGGLGYRVINRETMQLSIKAGPAWRRTDFVGGGSDEHLAGLAAMDFDWRLSESLSFTQDAEAFVQSGNSSFLSSSGLEVGLSTKLKARLSYTLEHDTSPPAGAVKTDTVSRVSVIYDF